MTVITLTKALKRTITQDWADCFCGLGVYRPMHLLRRVGPLLMGILLERNSSNRSYMPTFHVHNLCRADSSINLMIGQELQTIRTNAPDAIEARDHQTRYRECAGRFERQSPLRFWGDLSLESVLLAYDMYSRNKTIPHYDDTICYAVWANHLDIAEKIVRESLEAVRQWAPETLQRVGGYDHLERKWASLLGQREQLRVICEEQVVTLKASHLPVADLIA